MIEKGKIAVQQYAILVTLFCLGSSILIVPSALTAAAMQDGWISAVVGIGLGLIPILIINVLSSRYPQQSLVEFNEIILGKWLGKAVSLCYISFYFILAALVLRNVGDFLTTIVIPETPIEVVHIVFMVVTMMGVYLGIEVMARAAEVFLPWILLLIFILVAFLIPQIEIDRVQPVFEATVKQIFHGSLSMLSIPYFELVVFFMVYPYVNSNKKAAKALLLGGLWGGLIILIITVLCVFVLGWDFTSRHTYPSYTLAKKISIGEFLQRIEVLVAIIWFLTIFFKLALSFYASLLGFAQLFKVSSYRPLVIPFGMILVVLSMVVYPNIIYFRTFANATWPFYAATFGLFFPVVLLAVSSLRGLGKKN